MTASNAFYEARDAYGRARASVVDLLSPVATSGELEAALDKLANVPTSSFSVMNLVLFADRISDYGRMIRAQAAITEYQAACARWLEMQIREVDDLRAEKAREMAAGVVEVAR